MQHDKSNNLKKIYIYTISNCTNDYRRFNLESFLVIKIPPPTLLYLSTRHKKSKKKESFHETVSFNVTLLARCQNAIYKCLEFYRRCELRRPRCRHLMLLEAQGRPT